MCVAECCGPKVGSAIVPDHNTSAVLKDGCGGTAATIGKYSVSFEKLTLVKLIKNLVHDHIHKSPRHGLRETFQHFRVQFCMNFSFVLHALPVMW